MIGLPWILIFKKREKKDIFTLGKQSYKNAFVLFYNCALSYLKKNHLILKQSKMMPWKLICFVFYAFLLHAYVYMLNDKMSVS